MVNLMLMITAELENLTNLQPQGGCDDPNFTYYFKMRCGNCGEVTQKETCVSLNETVSLHQGKNTTNLVQKCKFCGRDGTVTMITGRGRPLTQEMSQSGKHTPLMLFDCRGYEPVEFLFGSGWKVESLEGTKFDDVDLSEGEFAEYDEKGQCPVMISNLRAVFNVVKQLIVCGLVYVSTGNRCTSWGTLLDYSECLTLVHVGKSLSLSLFSPLEPNLPCRSPFPLIIFSLPPSLSQSSSAMATPNPIEDGAVAKKEQGAAKGNNGVQQRNNPVYIRFSPFISLLLTYSMEMEKRQLFLRSYQFCRKKSVAERIKGSFFRVKRVVWSRFRSARKIR
ncbi:hypothetical protein TEA_024970 [Camellia sinensis var. sinensis]|uniref:Uncharacterized protein n=2 Tax=Camellia sinensis TaxID=4442 RepID=A0A4S4ES67_CAMSN|nr:hypothetical protein TEA_024970 [Camellia sinensis var. sinensis]